MGTRNTERGEPPTKDCRAMGSRAGDDHTANTSEENLPNDPPSSSLGYCWNLAPRVPASLGALQA